MNNLELLEEVSECDRLVIFGTGMAGRYLYDLIHRETPQKEIIFCDNDRSRQGVDQGRKVVSVEEAVRNCDHNVFLLPNYKDADIMRRQLLELGVLNVRIVDAETEEMRDYLNHGDRKKLVPLKSLQFEVDIAAHCNLNCECCSQFSCISEEEFINLDIMERDFQRLGELFHGKAERIYLIGGEPLLFPQITECMKIARTYFPEGKISIFTNGVLLLKQDTNFWEFCRKYSISLIVTQYPVSFDYQKAREKAAEEKVSFDFFGTSESFKYMYNLQLDETGRRDAEENFLLCTEANNCIKLRNGKLYTCTRPAAIYKFNRFFGKNFEVTEQDYVDIYQANSAEEILTALARPIPFCRYCNMKGKAAARPWASTGKQIEEWICQS